MSAADAEAAKFVVWSVTKSLNDKLKYANVKVKVMASLRKKLASITEDNQEEMCVSLMNYADELVDEALAAAAAAAAAQAGPDDWNPEPLPPRWGRGGSKRKRPSRKLRSSRKAQKKNRGFRRTRK